MVLSMVPATLTYLSESGSTFALLDVREAGEYNTSHIPGATLLPRRLIEFRAERLVPCRTVQVIICDDDGRRAALAARTFERMGYTRTAVLEGGLNRWASEGRTTEWGMNVPSKDFGEKVEVTDHVPAIPAVELDRLRHSGHELLILDSRTPEEFQRASIPGGRSVPGGELALRAPDIIRDHPDATVVVNCAGRTRSIIGARTLQRMGLANVVSLRNGTAGWTLAGLELEHGSDRVDLPKPSHEGLAAAERFAERVAAEDGVEFLDVDELQALLRRSSEETIYPIDVRTREEYEQGHIPGFWWFPGGQAVQRADDLAPVRNGTIIFCCDGIARSAVTASWFKQMGFPHVYAVRGGVAAWIVAGIPVETGPDVTKPFGLSEARAAAGQLSPGDLTTTMTGDHPPLVLFVDPSDEFAAGHIPGSHWLSRSWLELDIETLAPDHSRPLIVTAVRGRAALYAAATLRSMGYQRALALEGGVRAWQAAGRPIEKGLTGVMRPPTDIVPAGTDRSYADMVHYLAWEEALGVKYETAG
jgi:rhodanese-related sulfurtransferase